MTDIYEKSSNKKLVTGILAFCGVVTVSSIIAMAVMSVQIANKAQPAATSTSSGGSTIVINTGSGSSSSSTSYGSAVAPTEEVQLFARQPRDGENECLGKKVQLDNIDCLTEALENVLPQAGGNVTMAYTRAHMCCITVYSRIGCIPHE